jgi:hypothetical protein
VTGRFGDRASPRSSSRVRRGEFRAGSHSAPRYEYGRRTAGPAARILSPSPNATNGAIRATRRETRVTGFDCGAGRGNFRGGSPTSPLVSSPPDDARGFSPSFFRAAPIEGWEGQNTITRTERSLAPHRGGDQDRERGSRRVSHAVDAQRHLNTRRAQNARTKARRLGPRRPLCLPNRLARLGTPADARSALWGRPSGASRWTRCRRSRAARPSRIRIESSLDAGRSDH